MYGLLLVYIIQEKNTYWSFFLMIYEGDTYWGIRMN